MLALAMFMFLALGPGDEQLQVRQILQIPAQSQQTIAAVTTDSAGDVIATGQSGGAAFVTKIDSSGNPVFIVSETGGYGYGVAADASGNVYWIGAADPPGFPFTGSVLGSAPTTNLPGFLVKLNGSDGSIAWSMEIGPTNPYLVTIGPDGSVVVAGYASSANAAVTQGAYAVSTIPPATPIEVVKFSTVGALIFAATYGGSATAVPAATLPCGISVISDAACPHTSVAGVLVDPQNHVWITGSTNVSDLPITANALNTVCTCATPQYDGFLAELSADGSQLLYGTYIHRTSQGGTISAAAMDSAGNIWLGGSAPANLVSNGVPVNTAPIIEEYVPSSNQIARQIQTDVNGLDAFVGNIAVNPGDGTVAIAGVPLYDYNSPEATPQGFVETFDGNPPTGSAPTLTGLISLAGDAVGTGLAVGPAGSLVVAGAGSFVTELTLMSPNSPNIVSVTGSATTGIATGQVSPGEIITIFGNDLGPGIPATASASGQPLAFPSSLAGVRVLVGNIPAPLLYVSENQINAIVPFGAAGSAVTLTVDNNGSVSNSARLGVVTATPGVFTTQATSNGYPVAAALNQDGSINSSTNPAAPGSIVIIFATGFGALTTEPADGIVLPETGLPSLVTPVLVGSAAGFADILYAGPAPDEVAGVTQINFRLPPASSGESLITVSAGIWTSQDFTVWIAGN